MLLQKDKQELVYEEIMDVIGKDGPITFDKLGQLKYMDRFISESLRFNKLFPQLERVCTKNYKIPGKIILILYHMYSFLFYPTILSLLYVFD